MDVSQRLLIACLQGSPALDGVIDPRESARAFVSALVLETACAGLIEQHWLLTHGVEDLQSVFEAYLRRIFRRELAPLAYLENKLGTVQPPRLREVIKICRALGRQIVVESEAADIAPFRIFVREAVVAMRELALFFERLVTFPEMPAFNLYRTFDAMDEIFQLKFQCDHGMVSAPSEVERLYEGAGAGVQTSYASILCALENLQLPEGAHLVDLGSGYGRVGLLAGLWREDLRFTGYEFVEHRVEVANAAAIRAGLCERVKFITQNLAGFQIPEADVYYMYDPFCEDTYRQVLLRLQEIRRRRAIAVVTKGGAGARFREFALRGGWSTPESYDSGTLLLFRSKAELNILTHV